MDGESNRMGEQKKKSRTYFCIDMKCFFASVECAERGLDPFTSLLVVADESRGRGAICLAVSPALKALGVRNRCRLFEVPSGLSVIVAKPHMKKYIEYAADIYAIYLRWIAPEDIHVYSIDEAFLDVTDYLKCYRKTPEEFVRLLMGQIASEKRIPATAGIGSNLYLAKVALDITAKHSVSHIGILDEESYRKTLWTHEPLTDFWQVASGTVKRLNKHALFTMRDVALAPENRIYAMFGVNAELLIDHAWGRESCTMADIKNYRGKTHSISNSQILCSDYSKEKAKIVMGEMARSAAEALIRQKMVTNRIAIGIGYSGDCRPSDKGTVTIGQTTNLPSILAAHTLELFDRLAAGGYPIRRLSIAFLNLGSSCHEGYDLFTDIQAIERERRREETVLSIKDRFGKNALLRGVDYTEGATARERNRLIGGHNSE